MGGYVVPGQWGAGCEPGPTEPALGAEASPAPANAGAVDEASRHAAGRGLQVQALRTLPVGTRLYRVGDLAKGPNYGSPWWMEKSALDRIMAKGQRDPAWSARVLLAISDAWGSDCGLQLSAQTEAPLQAWAGEGRILTWDGKATSAGDPLGYWFPEAGIVQLYIPGLADAQAGCPLWQRVLGQRAAVPFLVAGNQVSLNSRRPFQAMSALKPGERPGSVR